MTTLRSSIVIKYEKCLVYDWHENEINRMCIDIIVIQEFSAMVSYYLGKVVVKFSIYIYREFMLLCFLRK